jgi:uncharacterized membrane protein HdeD (DUF308 family)
MAATRSDDLRATGYRIGGAVRRHWGLFLTEGIVLVVLGILALLAPQIFMALHARPTSTAATA